jgi:hypothetical protein
MNAICNALEAGQVNEITLEHECYWNVFGDDAFDFSQQPEPGIGSLSDDIGDLRREMEASRSDHIGMIVGHACEHLLAIVNNLALTCSGVVVSASDDAVEGGARA